jgi:hypothetical protein
VNINHNRPQRDTDTHRSIQIYPDIPRKKGKKTTMEKLEKPHMPGALPATPEPISPATMTNTTLCHSINSDVSLVKDPEFWRRFSMAVHRDEELAKTETEETQTQ